MTLFGDKSLYRSNQAKIRSPGLALLPYGSVLIKRKNLGTETCPGADNVKTQREHYVNMKADNYKPKREAYNRSFPHSAQKEPTLPTPLDFALEAFRKLSVI